MLQSLRAPWAGLTNEHILNQTGIGNGSYPVRKLGYPSLVVKHLIPIMVYLFPKDGTEFTTADEFARTINTQGMVDGSASKPALRQDTGYMVEKPYLDIAPYLEAFGAYLMPQ